MRQTASEPSEIAFRRALGNLRYRACDNDDIALLRSRIAGTSADVSVDQNQFRNVSIITSLNRDKDQINTTNSARFAAESGQVLEDFYCFDKLNSGEPKRVDPKKSRRVYSKAKSITKAMQVGLWNQPPCTSEQIPAKLSLCIGMPVMIRYNEATELCITRGQEARIVGWSAMKYPKWPGRKYLDVLYVELINPPHPVNLPHLPKNVVPLTRNSESIEAQLPNDGYVRISRSQIPVLPNFSMTDYSSQGKTREFNVVDLTECRNFQAAYTCLSRSTSLAGTLIIRDFEDTLLRGELDGALRQEYRELGYLTTITDLLYNGVLPANVLKATRWDTIHAYREWKAAAGSAVESAPRFAQENEYDPPKEKIVYEFNTIHATKKRKARDDQGSRPVKRRKAACAPQAVLANSTWAAPTGPVWDSTDWSCPYDAWTFIVHWLWVSDKVKWSRVLKTYSDSMATMITEFEFLQQRDPEEELSHVRDVWRNSLRATHPGEYPAGPMGTDIIALSEHLMGYSFRGTHVSTSCLGCRRKSNEISRLRVGRLCSIGESALSVQGFIDDCDAPLRSCEWCDGDVYIRNRYSEVLAFQVVETTDLLFNDRIDIKD
ncbi:hypothetical protein DFP72DRAFT_806437 [Ephemerocybe angulata]|uniref:Uncharacterized protein n=1 Tax=Ephemerocybe angulata TaxID=980116 RepID=A0A8H6I6S6_9AGAR|nr:hypothetical protein DFP72DRAFT_806437 [Tulosesus angulatus]